MTTTIIKRSLFVLTGLALITFIVLAIKSDVVQAEIKEGQKFDDWGIVCEKDKDGKKLCFLSQVLSSKDNPEQRIAELRFGYLAGKELKMLQILPFGVSLQSGTSVISGTKVIIPAKFTSCQPFGCIAVGDVKKEDLDLILSSKENYVGMISSEGKQMNIIMSNKGLKEGLEALK